MKTQLPETLLNYEGKPEKVNYPKGKNIYYDPPSAIGIFRQARGRFAVTYGLRVETGLTREETALETGRCILHYLETLGRLD